MSNIDFKNNIYGIYIYIYIYIYNTKVKSENNTPMGISIAITPLSVEQLGTLDSPRGATALLISGTKEISTSQRQGEYNKMGEG